MLSRRTTRPQRVKGNKTLNFVFLGSEKYPLVYLEWQDAVAHSPDWIDETEANNWADSESGIIHQVGFIIKETKRYIFLAAQISETDLEPLQFSSMVKIPTPWVLKRKSLNV